MSTVFDLHGKRVFVAGHRGMVGSAIVRRLAREDCTVLTVGRDELDLTDQKAVNAWIDCNKPDVVIIAAAKVGGINANNILPVDFLYSNLMIEANLIHAAHQIGTQKLLFLGSSCIYPRLAPQPMPEEALLTGPLEPTNEWYAIAKIAGIKLCQAYRRQYGRDFISAMPTNLYGPGDNFHPENGHVPAALMRRFHEAKQTETPQVDVWGTGTPLRDFLHVDDMADACVFLVKAYSSEEHVNVGSGEELTISTFAHAVKDVVGYQGDLIFDPSKPDGTPRKLMRLDRLHALGWHHQIALADGLAQTYRWFLENAKEARL